LLPADVRYKAKINFVWGSDPDPVKRVYSYSAPRTRSWIYEILLLREGEGRGRRM